MSYSGSNSSSSFNTQNRTYVSKNKSSYKSSKKISPNGFSLPRSSNKFSLNNLENVDKNNNTNFQLHRRNINNRNNKKLPRTNERRYLNSSPISKRVPATLINNNPHYYSPSPVITRVPVAQNDTLKATLEAFKRLTNGFPGIMSPATPRRAMWTPQRR